MFKTLLVEDNKAFREALRDYLRSHFPLMLIEEAADTEQGMETVDSFDPDLVFTDISLPDGSGLELTKRIKAGHPHTGVIVLTSYDLPEYREAALQNGANYFVTKSISSQEILNLVKSSMNHRDLN
jgi:DNA-binding NarL/FixJ family response regulator